MAAMEVLTTILADAAEPAVHERLHRLEHRGGVETVRLDRANLARRRQRLVTDRGREVAVALSREEQLFDGAVLVLEAERALVVALEAEAFLRVRPADAASALRLGYHAGNLHWRVHFEGADLLIALEREEAAYRDRLVELENEGRIAVVGVETPAAARAEAPS